MRYGEEGAELFGTLLCVNSELLLIVHEHGPILVLRNTTWVPGRDG